MTVDLDLTDRTTSTDRIISQISASVADAQRIVVLTGAGISCSCGIPDFRSTGGLYSTALAPNASGGETLFHASVFQDGASRAAFYRFISKMKHLVDSASPSVTHHFIKALDTKGTLLRSYTQNIDGLEAKVGLQDPTLQSLVTLSQDDEAPDLAIRNVQLHGDINHVRCTSCSAKYTCSEDHLKCFATGRGPDCPECLSRAQDRIARSARALSIGTLRPDILLYEEIHPCGDYIRDLISFDISRVPDMLIVMGTSLKVPGAKRLVKDMAKAIHAAGKARPKHSHPQGTVQVLFINKTPPNGKEWKSIFDYHITCDVDSWVNRVMDDWRIISRNGTVGRAGLTTDPDVSVTPHPNVASSPELSPFVGDPIAGVLSAPIVKDGEGPIIEGEEKQPPAQLNMGVFPPKGSYRIFATDKSGADTMSTQDTPPRPLPPSAWRYGEAASDLLNISPLRNRNKLAPTFQPRQMPFYF